MKVLILGDASNPNIIKWANALYSSGIEIIIFSFRKNGSVVFKDGIEIFCIDSLYNITLKKNAALSKVFYLKAIPQLKALIKNSKPDIIHAHYASSYGFLGALMNFHPFVISVWGSDVIDFPKTSILHKELFKFNLWKADRILSTSRFMADLISKYTSKEIFITPFGIDLELFKPQPKSNFYFKKDEIVVGCIKGDKGDVGAAGEQGEKGDQGIKGDQGDIGSQGIAGYSDLIIVTSLPATPVTGKLYVVVGA